MSLWLLISAAIHRKVEIDELNFFSCHDETLWRRCKKRKFSYFRTRLKRLQLWVAIGILSKWPLSLATVWNQCCNVFQAPGMSSRDSKDTLGMGT